ncbi:MAG TPA: NAD(P)H-hydrate dehydratase, partial [Burkholderiales bacterium]|nr:NAD(P)H-hydrate dehydratase [Burkholderiales bacterium]
MPASDRSVPVYRTAEIRAIEEEVVSRSDPPRLMERAGLAAAEIARTIAGEGSILVFAGPGNNGGDAFVLSRHLKQWWYKVEVVFAGDQKALSDDAKHALRDWRDVGGEIVSAAPERSNHGLVVDGIFGIGLSREPSGIYLDWLRAINRAHAPVLAIDVPSGLNSDTGRILGDAVHAAHTVTFIGLKPGLLTLDGPDYCGEIHVANLGLDDLKPSLGSLLNEDILRNVLPPRERNSHKGTYGAVAIIGGAAGMAGAALLAARAALYLGAGRVYVGCLNAQLAVDWQQPELMMRSAEEALKLDTVNCFVVGPGLGQFAAASHVLQSALATDQPLVLDADALNLIAEDEGFKKELRARGAPAIITPHPAEAARLLGVSTREIQNDRVAAALELASKLNCCALLKGSGTVCATPNGNYSINPTGNPGMASGGMGDVLSGMIGALIAQGVTAEK